MSPVTRALFLSQILPDWAGGGVFYGDAGFFELGAEVVGGGPVFVLAGFLTFFDEGFLFGGDVWGILDEVEAE